MISYIIKPPKFLRRVFPNLVWSVPNSKKKIYLTFDDGPIPEVTPWVLELLRLHQSKATFFCIGKNVQNHPNIYKQIVNDGHAVGNHTHHHLNGWKTSTRTYLKDIETAQAQLGDTSLFRPPYGRISLKQSKLLRKKGYKIIMWDVLSADFDSTISEKKCLQHVLQHIEPGSIVVFHDSVKAEKNLRYVLPKTLEFIQKEGWTCAPLEP